MNDKFTVPYIGNGPYCYANSTSMLLSQAGEQVSPQLIEVLSGAGLGAVLLGHFKLPFFSTYVGSPDRGVSKALEILGFKFIERSFTSEADDPFYDLEADLKSSPVVLGPLDMGYLDYNPSFQSLAGVDHFILVYGLGVHEVYLHDPAGFPCVSLFREQLRKAWQAKEIGYRQNFYRSWSNPQRVFQPTQESIFHAACEFFRQLYREDEQFSQQKGIIIGKEVFSAIVQKAQTLELSALEIEHLSRFALPLAGRRAADFAEFFRPFDNKLSELKRQQAEMFGRSQTLLMRRDFKSFSRKLNELSGLEQAFRQAIG